MKKHTRTLIFGMDAISVICVTEVDETPKINQKFSSGKGALMEV
jgi:hypothetical protein